MMAQTLLFKEKPKLQLTETDTSWMVVNEDDFPFPEDRGRIHSWGRELSEEHGNSKKDFEKQALEDHDALEVEWVKWDGVTY